jgi:hypothetical protein
VALGCVWDDTGKAANKHNNYENFSLESDVIDCQLSKRANIM